MSKKIEVKTLVIGLLVGGMVSFGTYFLLPPPQDAHAKWGNNDRTKCYLDKMEDVHVDGSAIVLRRWCDARN